MTDADKLKTAIAEIVSMSDAAEAATEWSERKYALVDLQRAIQALKPTLIQHADTRVLEACR